MNNHESLLVHVAQLYYHQNLNQSEISKIVGLSRPTVSRMLEEAREVGIVENNRTRSYKKRIMTCQHVFVINLVLEKL